MYAAFCGTMFYVTLPYVYCVPHTIIPYSTSTVHTSSEVTLPYVYCVPHTMIPYSTSTVHTSSEVTPKQEQVRQPKA